MGAYSAFVGREFPGEHAQQRGLADSVRGDEPYAITSSDIEIYLRENGSRTE
ncbi:hypothetical protein GCM10022247_10660 [Allokutzneria multivorans]|uniref:Uncharacterized protein n=1 Tax=Allokutzneria multivorans TaxID=1142134 RepID=A0ABP7R7Z2_9PSEU